MLSEDSPESLLVTRQYARHASLHRKVTWIVFSLMPFAPNINNNSNNDNNGNNKLVIVVVVVVVVVILIGSLRAKHREGRG